MFDQSPSIVYNPSSFNKPVNEISKDLGNTECQSELINQKFVAVCEYMASDNECLLLMGGRS
jgi:hypothetical protein